MNIVIYYRDLSVDNLRYLSSEQALADLAYFITYARDKYRMYFNKLITFGGSYPGKMLEVQLLKDFKTCAVVVLCRDFCSVLFCCSVFLDNFVYIWIVIWLRSHHNSLPNNNIQNLSFVQLYLFSYSYFVSWQLYLHNSIAP